MANNQTKTKSAARCASYEKNMAAELKWEKDMG